MELLMGIQSYQNEQIGRRSKLHSIRHLIALIDGTWVSASQKTANEIYSNVYKIGLHIDYQNDANEPQIAFYFSGLGSKTNGSKYMDGIFASHLPCEVEKVYINLCSNYSGSEDISDCDKIYLFGFSRGSVIARIVAEIICNYGLLYPSQIELYPYIWDDYMGARKIPDTNKFKKNYCSNEGKTSIEFMGLFDTVYGIYFGSNASNFKNIGLNDRSLKHNIKAAYHILAADEARRVFRPIMFSRKEDSNSILKQIWMPGVHSDVGGGYVDDFLSKISLLTMLDCIRENTYLKLDFTKSLVIRTDIEEALRDNKIVVNNEFKCIFRNDLINFGGRRVANTEDECQFIHPIYKVLAGRSYIDKDRKKQFFEMPKFPFDKFASISSLNNLD